MTGPLFGDLAVLQACRAYQSAVGARWPSPGLTSRLDEIASSTDPGVASKRWTKRR